MKRLFVPILLIFLTVTLSGCSVNDIGFFNKYLTEPFLNLINFTASLFAGNYGLAIVVVTLLIRLLLAPLFIKMYKNQRDMKEKMNAFKPEMDKIQKQLKETNDSQKKQELQQEMMQLFQKHGVNPLGMGCLPMLIQLPILMGFYFAIQSSKEIAAHDFLWFNLGQSDMILAIIACAIYFVQFKVSQANLPADQQKTMRFIGLLSPIFILFISLNYPAALPLYWAVSGLFMIVQTLVGKKLYPPKPEPKATPTEA